MSIIRFDVLIDINKCYDEECRGDNVINHLDEIGQVSVLLPTFYHIKSYIWFFLPFKNKIKMDAAKFSLRGEHWTHTYTGI